MFLPKPVIEIESEQDAYAQFMVFGTDLRDIVIDTLKHIQRSKSIPTVRKIKGEGIDMIPFFETLRDYLLVRKRKRNYTLTIFGKSFLGLLQNQMPYANFVRGWYRPAKLVATCREIYKEHNLTGIKITAESIGNNTVIITKKELIQRGIDKSLFLHYDKQSVQKDTGIPETKKKRTHKSSRVNLIVGKTTREKVEADTFVKRIGMKGDRGGGTYFLPFELLQELLAELPLRYIKKRLEKISANEFRLLAMLCTRPEFFTEQGLLRAELDDFYKKLDVKKTHGDWKLLTNLIKNKLVYELEDNETRSIYVCSVKPEKVRERGLDMTALFKIIKEFYQKYNRPITTQELSGELPEDKVKFSESAITKAGWRLDKKKLIYILQSGLPGRSFCYLPRCANPLEGCPSRHQRIILGSPYGYPLLKTYLALASFEKPAKRTEIVERAGIGLGGLKNNYLPFLHSRENHIVRRRGRSIATRYMLLDVQDYKFAMKKPEVVLGMYDQIYEEMYKQINEADQMGVIMPKDKRINEPPFWQVLEITRKELARVSKRKKKPMLFDIEPILMLIRRRSANRDADLIRVYNDIRKENTDQTKDAVEKVMENPRIFTASNRKKFLSCLYLIGLSGAPDRMGKTYIRMELIKDLLLKKVRELLNKDCKGQGRKI